MVSPVAHSGVGRENLLVGAHHRNNQVEDQGQGDNPEVLEAALIRGNRQADSQRNSSQQLVSDTEEGVEGVDAAERVGDPQNQNRTPACHHDGGGQPGAQSPVMVAELGEEVAQGI